MTASRTPQPFGELRTLLSRLQEAVQRAACAADLSDDSGPLFAQLDAWVESAEQRKRRSDSVIEAALDAVDAIDTDGCVVEWNREAERMFGWQAADIRGPGPRVGGPDLQIERPRSRGGPAETG